MIDRARPGLVALYDIRPGNGVGPFLQPRSLHGATLQSFQRSFPDILLYLTLHSGPSSNEDYLGHFKNWDRLTD